MKRANVTVWRNDVRPDGFKRWTVYCGGREVFDIEASTINGASIIHVSTAGPGGVDLRGYDSRGEGSYFSVPRKYKPSVCLAGNPTVEGKPCGDPDCVCA